MRRVSEQVEQMLNSQASSSKSSEMPHRPSFPIAGHSSSSGAFGTPNADFVVQRADIAVVNDRDHERWHFPGDSPQPVMENHMAFDPNLGMTMDPTFTWEMIGLGLDEPLPPQETIDELYVTYSELSDTILTELGIRYILRRFTLLRR